MRWTPFIFVDDLGISHTLSDESPAFLVSAMRSSRMRQLERAALAAAPVDTPGVMGGTLVIASSRASRAALVR